MIAKPSPSEWDTSRLPAERREYLDRDQSFEDMLTQLVECAEVTRIIPKPFDSAKTEDERRARQVVFVVRASFRLSDLLFNARDGLRGRYWQSPWHGFQATRLVTDRLSPRLIAYAEQNPVGRPGKADPIDIDDIRAMLHASSAKVWPRERDGGTWLFARDRLSVPRWETNEPKATNGPLWRDGPNPNGGDELEIKSALLGPPDNAEYVPCGKRARSAEIHLFGCS